MTVFTEEESIDALTENSERKDCDGRERGRPWEFLAEVHTHDLQMM